MQTLQTVRVPPKASLQNIISSFCCAFESECLGCLFHPRSWSSRASWVTVKLMMVTCDRSCYFKVKLMVHQFIKQTTFIHSAIRSSMHARFHACTHACIHETFHACTIHHLHQPMHLDACFEHEVGVGQLRGHVESKVLVVVHLLVSHRQHQAPVLRCVVTSDKQTRYYLNSSTVSMTAFFYNTTTSSITLAFSLNSFKATKGSDASKPRVPVRTLM